MRFADGEAANGVSGEIQFEELLGARASQIGEGSALHDAELPLQNFAVPARLFEEKFSRARRPLRGALDGRFGFLARRRSLNALVEHHGHVRAERQLNFRGFFRREQVLRAVQMRTKPHALVGQLCATRKE